MEPATVLYRPYTLPNPVQTDAPDMPTRFFTIGGLIWGMDPSSGRIIDVYGSPAPEGDAPGIRTKIEGFLSTLL